jgi:hypothetical protein
MNGETRRKTALDKTSMLTPDENITLLFSSSSAVNRKTPCVIPMQQKGMRRFAALVIKSAVPYCSVDKIAV